MQGPPPGSGRGARLALVGLALLALLTLVAFASRSSFGHGSQARPSDAYVSYAFTTLLIVFVLAIPLAAYLWIAQAREGLIPQKPFASRVALNIFTIIAVVALIGIAVSLRHRLADLFGHNAGNVKGPAGEVAGAAQKNKKAFQPHFEWPVLWATLLLLACVGGYVGYQLRRRREPPPPIAETSFADDVAATIDDAIDDLLAEPDPRRAVIAAYSRMEAVLARHGIRRRTSETPSEYLRRALLSLTDQGAAVRRLTSLFEEAKFSDHEIDSSMRDDAVDALTTIRNDLQPVPVLA